MQNTYSKSAINISGATVVRGEGLFLTDDAF